MAPGSQHDGAVAGASRMPARMYAFTSCQCYNVSFTSTFTSYHGCCYQYIHQLPVLRSFRLHQEARGNQWRLSAFPQGC